MGKAAMKNAKAVGFILVASLVGVVGWIYTRPLLDTVPDPTAEIADSMIFAAVVDVQLPTTFSAEAAAGETQYEGVCASCHGLNAAGKDGIAPPLVHKIYQPSRHGNHAFLVAMRKGTRQHHWPYGPMMPLERQLTDDEISAIIRYVRELQRENGIM